MYKKLITFVVACTLATTSYAFGVSDAIATFAGIMSAVIQKDNLVEMQTCAKDGDLLVTDVEILLNDVESLSFKGFFNAIITTGKIMGEAPFVFRDCEHMQDDFKTLGQQAEIFTNIGELTKRLTKNYVWHYTEIMTDINEANTDASTGNYYGFGENLGEAMMVALQP